MDSPPPHKAPRVSGAAARGPGSPAAQAAAAAVLALARAARSFVLYDPSNALVRQFLEEYQAKTRAALDAHGEMVLEVRPFEMLAAGEVVYRDEDREKSLAFKLFRDGVRRMTLSPSVSWPELLELLKILAVRYTGLRQQEDDTLTLLRRADLRGIAVVAVDGFTPAEEHPEPELDDLVERARHFQPPAGCDTPLPRLSPPGPLQYRKVPPELLAPLAAEEGEGAVAGLALSLVKDFIQEGARAGWPSPDPDLSAFLAELRDGLLAGGDLAPLRGLVDLLGTLGGSELRQELLLGLGDTRALDLVLESVSEDATRLPPDLVPLLPLLGTEAALDKLAASPAEARRHMLTQVLLARLPREVDAMLARLPGFDPQLAGELGRGIAARVPERALEVARQLLARGDEQLRLVGLEALESAPGAIPLQPVCELLRDASSAVRVRAAEVLGRRGDETVIDALKAALEQGDVPPNEAEALGCALAGAAPIVAARLFAGWIEPQQRFLRGLSPAQRARQWAAVAGMGFLPGSPEQALSALARRSDGKLRQHCLATLARRRRADR